MSTEEEKSFAFRMTIMSLMVITGAIDTLVYKFQNKQQVTEGGIKKQFFHPYMQAASMFLGEALAFFVFRVKKWQQAEKYKKRQEEAIERGKDSNMNKFLFAVPPFFDMISTTMQYFALNFVNASIYQMIRGGSIVTTLLFSILLLKVRATRGQLIGGGLAIVGIAIVGTVGLLWSNQDDDQQSGGLQVMGYLLLLAAMFTHGFQFAFEEKLLRSYYIEPLEMVGFEGLFGLCYQTIIVISFNFIPCSFGVEACVLSSSGDPFLQRPIQYFKQLGNNPALLIFCIFGSISIMCFNVLGVSVTKYVNALARMIADVSRTVIIWGVGLLITATAGEDHPNYRWETLDLKANLLQLLGFIILVSGNLVYNGILPLPCIPKKEVGSHYLLNNEATEEDIT